MGRTIVDLARDVLTNSEDRGRVLLRRSWLSAVTRELVKARRAAGLSQQELAERLGTTQSAIARLERDRDGRFTVHRIVDYALAVGSLPVEMELVSFDVIRDYAVAHPHAPRDVGHVGRDGLQAELGQQSARPSESNPQLAVPDKSNNEGEQGESPLLGQPRLATSPSQEIIVSSNGRGSRRNSKG